MYLKEWSQYRDKMESEQSNELKRGKKTKTKKKKKNLLLVNFQSTAWRVAFSKGSPISSSSICTREWQVASTWLVLTGAVWVGTKFLPLNERKKKMNKKYYSNILHNVK